MGCDVAAGGRVCGPIRLGDVIRGTPRATGWANTASARQAHTDPTAVLGLHGIT
ncbi:hypothetical protein EDD90_2169 [Streptomyces sp. Ag109_O5-1]|nr:hypothetical protein EDD90_2169 [Streptomyces sp. Ag109_O5-1]